MGAGVIFASLADAATEACDPTNRESAAARKTFSLDIGAPTSSFRFHLLCHVTPPVSLPVLRSLNPNHSNRFGHLHVVCGFRPHLSSGLRLGQHQQKALGQRLKHLAGVVDSDRLGWLRKSRYSTTMVSRRFRRTVFSWSLLYRLPEDQEPQDPRAGHHPGTGRLGLPAIEREERETEDQGRRPAGDSRPEQLERGGGDQSHDARR